MSNSPFDSTRGMSLLHGHKFEEASDYFSKYLDNNAIAYYGLALAKFRTETTPLSVEKFREAAALFEKSVELSPDFADAYFMCAMAYNAMAGLQLRGLNNQDSREPRSLLDKADMYIDKAVTLKPAFNEIAQRECELNKWIRAALDTIERSP